MFHMGGHRTPAGSIHPSNCCSFCTVPHHSSPSGLKRVALCPPRQEILSRLLILRNILSSVQNRQLLTHQTSFEHSSTLVVMCCMSASWVIKSVKCLVSGYEPRNNLEEHN